MRLLSDLQADDGHAVVVLAFRFHEERNREPRLSRRADVQQGAIVAGSLALGLVQIREDGQSLRLQPEPESVWRDGFGRIAGERGAREECENEQDAADHGDLPSRPV